MDQLLNLANEPATWIGFAAGVPTGMGLVIALFALALRSGDMAPRCESAGLTNDRDPAPSKARQSRQDSSAASTWPAASPRTRW